MTALKTVIARFTELKENVAGTEDSEFDDLDYNKVDTALKSVGVQLKDTNGQFRDSDDVFLELAQKWNTLDRNAQRYVATIAAGSRQQSRFIALMENYDRTMELIDTAYNSAGRSSAQFAKYQDTLEYKLKQLTNTWEQFRTNFFNSDFFKNVIDGLNSILKKISDFDKIDIASLAMVWITFGKDVINNTIKGIKDSSTLITGAITKVLDKVKIQFKGKTFEIGMGAKTQELEKKIQEANERFLLAKRKIEENKIDIDINIDDAKRELNELETKYNEFYNEAVNLKGKKNKKYRNNPEKYAERRMKQEGYDPNRINELREINTKLQNQEEGKREAKNSQETLDKLLGKKGELEKQSKIRGQFIGDAIGSAITVSMTAAITADDPMEAISTVLLTGLGSLIPSIISMITVGGEAITASFVASTAGIGALVIGITAAITGIIALIKRSSAANEAKKAENQVKQLNAEIQELDEQITQTKSNLASLTNDKKSLEEIQKTYDELGNKTVKTTEEQEKYNDMVEALKEDYPELITYYNEENNQIQISNNLLDAKLKKQKELIAEEQKLVNLQLSESRVNQRELNKQQFVLDITDDGGIFEDVDIALDEFSDLEEIIDKVIYTKEDLDNYQNIDFLGATADSKVGKIIKASLVENYGEDWDIGLPDINGHFTVPAQVISMINKQAALDLAVANGEITKDQIPSYQEKWGIATEIIEKFSTSVEEYVQNIQAINTELADINMADTLATNSEIISQQLGTGLETATSILSQQAVDIQETIGENLDYKEAKKTLKDRGYDVSAFSGFIDAETLKEKISFGYKGANWGNLGEDVKSILRKMGYEDAKTWNDYANSFNSKEELKNDFNRKYEALIDSTIAEILSSDPIKAEKIQEAMDEFFTKMPEMTLAEIEDASKKFATTYNISEDDMKAITGYNAIKEAQDNIKNTGIKNYEDLSAAAIQSFSKIINEAHLSDSQRDVLGDAINNVVDSYNLSSEQMNQLLQIDLKQGYQQIQANSDTYINALMSVGLNLEEATAAFNSYLQNISTMLGKGIYNAAGAEVFQQILQDNVKGFKETNGPLIEARNSMLENGKLDTETYFELLEAGFKDYVKITTNGYELITEKAEEALKAQALEPLKQLREQMSIQDDLIKEAQKMTEDWKDEVLTNQQAYDMGLITGPFNGSITGSFDASMDELVAKYKELKDAQQDTSAFSAIFGDKMAFIDSMIQQGYTSLKEFIQALKEGKVALSGMEADTWIQGLENLQEAEESAADKVKDLKDQLADLNEQLAEDQKAIAEAEEKLQEAIHGSDDFRSSLDGLANYVEKIERLNRAIEKTKESLEDVANIDDAKGLLSQLNGQYNDKTITISAENIAIDKALSNLQSTLLQNYGDYITFDSEGNPLIDYAYQTMDANDEIRKAFEEEYNLYNEYRDKKEENLDALDEIEKEREERQEESLRNFVAIQDDIISILKEKAKEEIDATKDKYEALEEADNDYLDALEEAIDKQRELRDRQNQYEDLATKEKKLSLLQRDTSGANRKEAMSLQNEIEDDRQNLLDSEVDSLIESMKELYEKQKEARDAEIEYMEEVTGNAQYFAEWASNIMSTWQSVEDMQAWYLENDPNAQDMTVEQTELYLNEIEEKYSDYIQYVASTATDFAMNQEELNAAITSMYESTYTNIEDIGTVTQETAQNTADELIAEATEARDDAIDKMNDTQQKIAETQQKLAEAEEEAVALHTAAMEALVEASQAAISKVSTYATKRIAERAGYDLSNSEDAQRYAKDYHHVNSKGQVTANYYHAVKDSGGDVSKLTIRDQGYQVSFTPNNSGGRSTLLKTFRTEEEAKTYIKQNQKKYANGKLSISNPRNLTTGTFHGIEWGDGSIDDYPSLKAAQNALSKMSNEQKKKKGGNPKAFKTGGIVDYTGPAWVDGTPMKPEAFLNSEDTKRIGDAAKILADIPILNSTSNAQNAVSTNVGDTTIEIHINVENIESDYDVDQMIDRVKKDIVDVSKPVGTPVILRR